MNKIIVRACFFGWILAFAMGSSAEDRKTTLVKDGTSAAVIVTAASPTVSAQLGAKELQWHVRQITGAQLPIITEGEKSNGGVMKLYIGDTLKARESGLGQSQFNVQEHAIKPIADGIVFVGKDKDDRRVLTYDAENPAKLVNLPSFYDERGSAEAVYDFLENACGVRWLAASTTGTVIPQSRTLTVSIGDHRHKASFEMRCVDIVFQSPQICMWKEGSPQCMDYYESAWPGAGKDVAARRNLWMLCSMRWHNGGVPMIGNHSLYGYYERFSEAVWKDRLTKAANENEHKAILESKAQRFEGDHPEFFAKGYDNEAVPPQLCYTSKALVKQVAKDAREYYAGKLRDSYFNAYFALPNPFVIEPMDNGSFCKCESCQKWCDDTKTITTFSSGKYSNYHFQFVNAVARELKKTYPDKPILTLAYGTHAAMPDKVQLEPAILVQYCHPCNRGTFMLQNDMVVELQQIDQWVAEAKQSGRELSLWFYNTFPKEGYDCAGANGFPGFFAHEFARQIRDVQTKGFKGIFHCGWGQDVENYVGFKLMYDVDQDVDTLLDDYFNGLYGAAAAPMKQMYQEMEQVWADPANRVKKNVGGQELCWTCLGSPSRMTRWQKLFDAARSAAKTDREQKNLALFDKAIWSYMRTGFDTYTTRMACPIPSVTVPKVTSAGGDCANVDWTKAARPVNSWSRQTSPQPSRRDLQLRIAHDGEYLYLKFTDPCGDVRKLSNASPYDTLELFTANSRATPYRQFIALSGDKKKFDAFLQGEINWRMGVPFANHHIRYDVSCPDSTTEVMLLAMPLNEIVPGGRQLKPGDKFYMNVVRVTPPSLTHPDDRVDRGYSIDSLTPFCTLREVDRLAEFTLSQ